MAKTKLSYLDKKQHQDAVEQMRMYGRACQSWIPGVPLIMNPVARAEARYYDIMELKCSHWCSDKAAEIANKAIERFMSCE